MPLAIAAIVRARYRGALFQAAWNGALDVINVLLDAKVNVDAVNKQGFCQ